MAALNETAQWEDEIYQLETTDPVEGGPDGIDNRQAKELANRTAYLKQQVDQKTGAASDTTAGIAKLATQPEVNAGTNDTSFITPLKLKNWVKQATETVLGMLKVATQTQVDAGTSDDVAVTPKKLRWGFSYSLGQTGYIRLPSWLMGFTLEWGVTSTINQGETASITLPLALSTTSSWVIACPRSALASTAGLCASADILSTTQIGVANTSQSPSPFAIWWGVISY